MNYWDMPKIGVFGSASGSKIEENKSKAVAIGVEIARLKGILCNGACEGLPYEAALSASNKGGLAIGFSPAMDIIEHTSKYDLPDIPYIIIYTGMDLKGRNIICTRTCEAGIFISGSFGTMNEFTLMYDEGAGKVIGLLEGSGGFVDDIIPILEKTEKKSEAIIIIERDPIVLVNKIFKELDAL